MNVKLIKKKENLLCFSYEDDGDLYFAKLFYFKNNEKLKKEYMREVEINNYISENIENKKYHTRLIKIYEDIEPFDYILPFIDDKIDICNILIFEHSGSHPLRYYINKLSKKNFNDILYQLKEATLLLENIGVIHYDLYCQNNIMLKKHKNNWIIKIIDYGLSYIDKEDKTKHDYRVAIESIKHFSKKHDLIDIP